MDNPSGLNDIATGMGFMSYDASLNAQLLLGASVFKGLNDKSYEKRKQAAVELEKVMQECIERNDRERIEKVILVVKSEFIESPQPNTRKGGLIAIASIAQALEFENVSST